MSAALLGHYETLREHSAQMLVAARAGDWDRVRSLELACTGVLEALEAARAGQPMRPEGQRRKLRIVRDIVTNDREVRYLAQPWERELEALLAGGIDRLT